MNYCVNCGKEATMLHHIVPKALGGNNKDNLVWLCDECHGKIHEIEYNKTSLSHSELTKIGLEKVRKEPCQKLIGLYDFYITLNEILEKQESIDVIDVLDIIDNLPSHGFYPIKN